MKSFYLFLVIPLIVVVSCSQKESYTNITINEKMLLHDLKAISHDSLEGRFFGTVGNLKTQQFLARKFDSLGLASAFESGMIQPFEYTFSGERRQRLYPIPNAKKDFSNVPDTTVSGGNVVVKIEGKSEKVIIITAHFDHLARKGEDIYNGADDNGSGTAALLAIADFFKSTTPNHTFIIAAVDAEEIGSLGAEYLLHHFPTDTANIVLNINMDMIAHNDSNRIYASGLFHNPQLEAPLKSLHSPIKVLFGHDNPNDTSLDDWTFSSDHRVFHRVGIPFIYFGVEDHKDYHQPSDTFENINQEFYVHAVKLVIEAIQGYDEYLE